MTMPSEHAVLSPSSAERWIACPPSVELCKGIPDEDSPYAAEGTHAHEVHEIVASEALGLIDQDEYIAKMDDWGARAEESWSLSEMHDYALAWADQLKQAYDEGALVYLEKRMPSGVEGVWGTSDAVLIWEDSVEIWDLKYGQGVRVEAEDNPQLYLYALGALKQYGNLLGETKTVCVRVWQPRLNHDSSYCLEVEDLLAWRDETVIPAATMALAGEGEFNPGVNQCRWCPAAGRCEAQVKHFAEIDFAEDPALLGPDDLSVLIEKANEAQAWAAQVHNAALKMAEQDGEHIPGYKLVRSAGRRSIKDHDAAIEYIETVEWLSESEIEIEELVDRKLIGIGALEKKLGKDGFDELLGDFVGKSEGKISLVPEDDKRPAVDRSDEAAKDFSSKTARETPGEKVAYAL